MQLSPEILQSSWFLSGPTACGKSEVGLILAQSLDAEIVSLDSMSLYRGMNIGTAKPSLQTRAAVKHHLVDVIEPHEEFSLALFAHAAAAGCRQIVAREKTPLFVGGTGLYLRSLIRGIFEGPPADRDFRHALETEASHQEPGYLLRRLHEVDPVAAARLHVNDTRRLIRALEVHHLTGRPLSQQQHHSPLPVEQRPRHVYWLSPPREWLYRRIDQRVEQMFSEGFLEEVQNLLTQDLPFSRTARQALGYKEAIDHLQAGTGLQETIKLIQTRTRQFAKRQLTWYRNLEECVAIEITGEEAPTQIADRILSTAGTNRGPESSNRTTGLANS